MRRTIIAGIGHYVPEHVETNDDLSQVMETSDAWIRERTGIQTRRFADKHKETPASMGAKAAELAIERAGIAKEEVDFIIFATLSPDYYFPGSGVLLQRELGLSETEIGALDIRTQCTGFIYGLTVADQFIRSGMYKNVLLVGAEKHSMGLDFTTRGRNVSVIFGDGAGAALLQATEDEQRGILASCLHSDGRYAEILSMINPGSHGGYHHEKLGLEADFGYESGRYMPIFVTEKMLNDAQLFPYMDGPAVFKFAVQKFPAAIVEVLEKAGLEPSDLDLLVPHQADLRISQFVQKKLRLRDDQVYNNIQRYGNTTAASIPIALSEAWEEGRVKEGDVVCLAAFGSGFTWGANLLRW